MNNPYKNYKRNNLDISSSPYLVQHRDNPVWWQEWSEEVIGYARYREKPLFVSVGYSTCHWCHVMASEAFSDERTARYLNDNFVCIKVDREQRPDIDQYLMNFIQKQSGNGGWPLNVFLTPFLKPVFALTYAPVAQRGSMNTFLSIVQQVYSFYQKHKEEIAPFELISELPDAAEENSILRSLSSFFDQKNGGFGNGHKFPSHSTLLFLLYRLSVDNDLIVREMCYNTLEAMRLRGLNDHLRGGIFRYCVDSEWTIPHFEKMLYDQAMSLWIYSLAYKVFNRDQYKLMAENIIHCLEETYNDNGLFITAHDADTDHREGATYLWSRQELKEILTDAELSELSGVYEISVEGNFEGKNHLIRKNDTPLARIESKLLSARNSRKQPSKDGKILCGNNALAAIAFIQAGRMLDRKDLKIKGEDLVKSLISIFWDGTRLSHSYYREQLQEQQFLTDASALFSAITYLFEEDYSWGTHLDTFEKYLLTFRKDAMWIESSADDFIPIEASWFDHPVPSGAALAEFGLYRSALLSGRNLSPKDYLHPYQHDFYNVAAMISNGLFHVISSNKLIDWNELPANSIQVRGEVLQDCYKGICRLAENGTLVFDV